jgi:hypothetical protein
MDISFMPNIKDFDRCFLLICYGISHWCNVQRRASPASKDYCLDSKLSLFRIEE